MAWFPGIYLSCAIHYQVESYVTRVRRAVPGPHWGSKRSGWRPRQGPQPSEIDVRQ